MTQARLRDVNEPIGKIIVAKTKKGEILTGECIIARKKNIVFKNVQNNRTYSLGKNTKLLRILSEPIDKE